MAILNSNAIPLAATSGNVAAAIATATLPALPGRMTYITGFQVTGAGATAPSVVDVTVGNLGVPGSTILHYELTVATGATIGNQPLIVNFDPPLPATGINTTISVVCPSLGAGGTNNCVNAMGYYL